MSIEDGEEDPQIKITNDNLNVTLSDIPSQLPPPEALSLSQGTSADAELKDAKQLAETRSDQNKTTSDSNSKSKAICKFERLFWGL